MFKFLYNEYKDLNRETKVFVGYLAGFVAALFVKDLLPFVPHQALIVVGVLVVAYAHRQLHKNIKL